MSLHVRPLCWAGSRSRHGIWGIFVYVGFYGMINPRMCVKMISMLPSIPFSDFRGASIAALGSLRLLLGFTTKNFCSKTFL